MKSLPILLLNAPIVTSFGVFRMKPATIEEAKKEIEKFGFESAIGHESTAQILSTLLNIDVKVNRIQATQGNGQKSLVFKLKKRGEEGKIYTKEEIETIGYELCWLNRSFNCPVCGNKSIGKDGVDCGCQQKEGYWD